MIKGNGVTCSWEEKGVIFTGLINKKEEGGREGNRGWGEEKEAFS